MCLSAQDRREEAREERSAALAGFEATEALGGSPSAPAAALRAAGASPPAAADPADPRRAHAAPVGALAQARLSRPDQPRDRGGTCSVSTKTVEHHLRNTFRKLGIRRRAELVLCMAVKRFGPVSSAHNRPAEMRRTCGRYDESAVVTGPVRS